MLEVSSILKARSKQDDGDLEKWYKNIIVSKQHVVFFQIKLFISPALFINHGTKAKSRKKIPETHFPEKKIWIVFIKSNYISFSHFLYRINQSQNNERFFGKIFFWEFIFGKISFRHFFLFGNFSPGFCSCTINCNWFFVKS